MKRLLMISGDRSILSGHTGSPFAVTLHGLASHFEHIHVLCPHVPGARTLKFLPNIVLESSPIPLLLQSFWIAHRGRSLHSEHPYDIVTVHEYPPFYNGLGARLLMHSLNIPFIAEIHHLVGEPHSASLSEWCGRVLSKVMLPWHLNTFTAVRVVNSFVAEILVARGVQKEKVHVVPSLYLDRTLLVPDPTIEKSYDVVVCGRLVKNKGLFEVLESISRLPHHKLLVIGDGPLRSDLVRKVSALGLQNRVSFSGWLPAPSDVVRSLQSAKVFMMNSCSEGGPRVLLEAMALGLPVIATPVGIVPSVLQDGVNGILTDGTVGDLTEKLQHVLADSALQKRIGAAATSVIDRFDMRRTLPAYAQFLLERAATYTPRL